jgi:pantoate--beta-alanine ligase
MILTYTAAELRSAVAVSRRSGGVIGFVPTMGFLHEGHLSLVDAARDAGATAVVVSAFVNPTQFSPSEDFARYPRNEERDRALLDSRGVDILFRPRADEIYPPGFVTTVRVEGVSGPLEGARRPGHFEGVATIVLKLLNMAQPDIAVFGRKDAQQCAVVQQMVRDLNVPVRLVFTDTVRESDGLAMSSRNSYLTTEGRKAAPLLHRALQAGRNAIVHGIHDVGAIEELMRKSVAETEGLAIDYLVVVDPLTFAPPPDFHRDVLVGGAMHIGSTRIIDNIFISRSEISHTHVAARFRT